MARLIGAIVALVCGCTGAAAQMSGFFDEPMTGGGGSGNGGGGVTLLGATRVVASWDFDDEIDRRFGVPQGWFRSVHNPDADPPTFRPGFPVFNLASVEELPWTTPVEERGYGVRVPTKGGSASLMLARGRVVAMPGSDYMVTARVRTRGLEHAGARVGVRFVDGALDPIDGAGAMSEVVRSGHGWTTVRVRLEGHEDAAYLQLEMQLVQPGVFDHFERLSHELVEEDFSGEAWFDELRLYQVPRIDFSAKDEENVVVSPARPELSLRVQDFTGETLVADARVYGVDGTIIAEKRLVDGGATGAGSSSTVTWTPELPAFGWYRAVVLLRNEQGVVGQRACDLCWLSKGPKREVDDRSRFGVVLGEADELVDETDEVVALLEDLKTAHVWLGLWERARREGSSVWGQEGHDAVRRLIERLVDRRHELSFVLGATPRALADAARTEPDDVLNVIAADPGAAMSVLEDVLVRYSESASSWHLGPVGSERVGRTDALRERLSDALDAMGSIVPRPIVSMGWGPTMAPDALGSETAGPTVRVDGSLSPAGVAALARGWRGLGAPPTLVFEPLNEERFGVAQQVQRLSRQMVSAWSSTGRGEGVGLAVRTPWRRALDGRGGAMPTPAYGVMRTMSEELAGRVPVAEMYAGEGARAVIGRGSSGGTGVIVAWNEWGRAGDAQVRGRLAEGAVTVRDHFGNTRLVELTDGEHVIDLGPTPVFISGIDTELVLFRSGLRLEPRFLESRAQRHAVELVVENPWRETVQVAVRFAEPEAWEFGPRVVRASVPGLGSVRVPVGLALGVGETSGRRAVVAEVALTTAAGEQPVQLVPMFVELGMEELRVTPSYRYMTGADGTVTGVVVSLLIANHGDREVPLTAFAFAPGHAAKEQLIPSLGPGQSIVRRFSFPNAGDLVGEQIRAGVREVNGNGRLNYWVELR